MHSTVAIPLGSFQPGSSILHRFDPRAKLIAFSLTLAAILLTDNWPGLGLLFLAVATPAFILTEPGHLWRDFWAFRYFYLLTILIHMLFNHDGSVLITIQSFTLTRGGLNAGCFFSVKIALMAILGGIVSRTTHPADLAAGVQRLLSSLSRLGRPDLVVGLALRMLPTILAEAERIRTAQIARGLRLGKGGPAARIRQLFPLIGPLMMATLRRGDLLHAAMIARGFALDAPRTTAVEPSLKPADRILLILGAALSLSAVVI